MTRRDLLAASLSNGRRSPPRDRLADSGHCAYYAILLHVGNREWSLLWMPRE